MSILDQTYDSISYEYFEKMFPLLLQARGTEVEMFNPNNSIGEEATSIYHHDESHLNFYDSVPDFQGKVLISNFFNYHFKSLIGDFKEGEMKMYIINNDQNFIPDNMAKMVITESGYPKDLNFTAIYNYHLSGRFKQHIFVYDLEKI